MSAYDDDLIPSEDLVVNGRKWTYEKIDSEIHHWTRCLDGDELDWEVSDVELVGTDVPIRVVCLELQDQWTVSGLETAGPDYHRPGFTETISSEFVFTSKDLDEAVGTLKEYISKLS